MNEIGRLDDLLEFSEVLAVGHDVGLSATVCEDCEVSQICRIGLIIGNGMLGPCSLTVNKNSDST